MESLKMNGAKLSLLLLLLLPLNIFAIDALNVEHSITTSSAYYFPDQKGWELDGNTAPINYTVLDAENELQRNLGSTWGGAELKLAYKLSLSHKLLTGGSFLTKDNQIKYSFDFNITPVNAEIGTEIIFTPIAFLDFAIGSTASTGWKAAGITGLGLNNVENKLPNSDALQGILSQSWLKGTFKFDLSAVLSGDKTWKHVIVLSSHKLIYKNFSAADSNDPWIFQGGTGNRYNGFVYNHSSFIGYQMPLILEMAGFLIETETNLFDVSSQSTMNSGGWGSDFIKVRLGGLFNLKFNDNHSLALIPQFTTAPHYTSATNREIYFKNREVDINSPIYFDFERIALIYTYKS